MWLSRKSIVDAVAENGINVSRLNSVVKRIGNSRVGEFALHLARAGDHERAPGYLMLQPLSDAAREALPPAPALMESVPAPAPAPALVPQPALGSTAGDSAAKNERAGKQPCPGSAAGSDADLAALVAFLAAPGTALTASQKQALLQGALPAGRLRHTQPGELARLALGWHDRDVPRSQERKLAETVLTALKVRTCCCTLGCADRDPTVTTFVRAFTWQADTLNTHHYQDGLLTLQD